jgi:hypothetical protein
MFDQSPADDGLVVLAVLLLLCELYALGMVYSLKRHAEKVGEGVFLLRVVFRFGIFVVLAQTLTVTNALLRLADPLGTYDARLTILLVGETMMAFAFIWTVWEIHHLPADTNVKDPPAEPPKPIKRISEQINNSVPGTSAPVDQGDDNAPVTPV